MGGFHSANMLKPKIKGAANKASPLKVKSVADLTKKTAENGHSSNGSSESNKSSKNINGKDRSKEEIDSLEEPEEEREEDPEEDPLKINSDEAMETDNSDSVKKVDSGSKSNTPKSKDKAKPQIRVRTGLEQVESKNDTENGSDNEVVELSDDQEEKIEDTPDTDSSNASKKGKKGENTSNEGESDGGSEKEDVVEMSTEDKEEESKEGKKKDDGNDILIVCADKET